MSIDPLLTKNNIYRPAIIILQEIIANGLLQKAVSGLQKLLRTVFYDIIIITINVNKEGLGI